MNEEKVSRQQVDQEHVPLVGWLVIAGLSALFASIAGSFMSLAFYYMRGWIALPLYYIHRDWVAYDGDIAWTLGFLCGVGMVLFGKSRWRRITPKQKKRQEKCDEQWDQEQKQRKPINSIDAVVTRTVWGTLIGLLGGLVIAFVLEMMFISASISPFGPTSWKEAVSVERRREPDSFSNDEEETMAISSSHPLFKYLFFVPVCAMPVVGGGVGCVTAVRSWRRS